jgi:exodeoxyribonuclease V alpha subunit
MISLDASQMAAIQGACDSRFAMITGGAGTGKTSIIKELSTTLRRLEPKASVALCAFAGKAAARLKEATKYNASTIHRLLGSNGTIFMAGPLTNTTVIIDEASMVSSDLLAEIVRRSPRRLILVGDAAQLPPVGKGQPFHDLLKLCPESTSVLSTCYRNSEAVYQAASAIRAGEIPLNTARSPEEKWDICRTGDAANTQRVLMSHVEKGFIDFDNDIILVPRNGDNDEQACTVKGLNRMIVDAVNPREGDEKFRVGDRVMNTKNFADADVWNGTTGSVHAIDSDGGIWITLDVPIRDMERSTPDHEAYKDTVLFDRTMARELKLAYALTVHKAQGSQYRRVVFIALRRDSRALLDRGLIYTAVTRTKEQCVVMGQYDAFAEGIRTVREKRTVIQELAG